MESWAIFKHAVWMVFANFKDALRVTGALYLAVIAAQTIFVGNLLRDDAAMQAAMMDGTMPWGGVAIYFFVVMIATTWAAIGWHRFVLLEERPAFVPKLLPGTIMTYLGKIILVVLVLLPVAIVLGGIFGLIGGILAVFIGIDGIVVGPMLGSFAGIAAAYFMMYRFAPLFPAIALGLPMGFGEAWQKLRHKNTMLLGLVFISGVVMAVLALPTFILSPSSVIALIIYHVTSWLSMIVAASILTTLYGVYVEGRELAQS